MRYIAVVIAAIVIAAVSYFVYVMSFFNEGK